MTTELRERLLRASGAHYRLARALFDYLTGIDPSGIGLAQTLLGLIPRRASHR